MAEAVEGWKGVDYEALTKKGYEIPWSSASLSPSL